MRNEVSLKRGVEASRVGSAGYRGQIKDDVTCTTTLET